MPPKAPTVAIRDLVFADRSRNETSVPRIASVVPAEVFRFMTIRPPQAAPATGAKNVVVLATTRSDFLTSLAEKRKAGSRDGMEKVAAAFIAGDGSFISTKRQVYATFLAFHEAIHSLDERAFATKARDALARTVGTSATRSRSTRSPRSSARQSTNKTRRSSSVLQHQSLERSCSSLVSSTWWTTRSILRPLSPANAKATRPARQ